MNNVSRFKGQKNIYHANINQNKGEMAKLIANKVYFRAQRINRDRDNHYIMIKDSIHHKVIVILNVYAPYSSAAKYEKQTKKMTEMKTKENYSYG